MKFSNTFTDHNIIWGQYCHVLLILPRHMSVKGQSTCLADFDQSDNNDAFKCLFKLYN